MIFHGQMILHNRRIKSLNKDNISHVKKIIKKKPPVLHFTTHTSD